MKLPIMINVALILIIAISVSKKKLGVLENLFIFMVLEFLITGYFALLAINFKVWDMTQNTEDFIILRIYEVIVTPLLYLGYFNLMPGIKFWLNKCLFTAFFVGILYTSEFLLVKWKVITYKGWQYWQSLLVAFLILFITYILNLLFKRILRKEGIGR